MSFDVIAKFLYGILNAPRTVTRTNTVTTNTESPSITTSTTTTLAASLSQLTSPEFIKWAVSVLSAMVASVMACLLSQPGDVILTETYKGGECNEEQTGASSKSKSKAKTLASKSKESNTIQKKRSLSQVSSTIYSRHGNQGLIPGLSGFFTGTQARLVHVGMIITSQLVIYDLVKQLLGLPATGSH